MSVADEMECMVLVNPECTGLSHTLSDWNLLKNRQLKYFIFCEHFLMPQKTFPVNQFQSIECRKLHFRESNFKNFLGKHALRSPKKFLPPALNVHAFGAQVGCPPV